MKRIISLLAFTARVAIALLILLSLVSPVSAQVSRGQFVLVTLKASGAVTGATVYHATVSRLQNFREAIFFLNVTAQSAASPDRLRVFIQQSPDNTNWQDVVRFADITTATAARVAQWQGRIAPTTAERAQEDVTMGVGVLPGPTAQNWRVVSAGSAAVNNTWTYTLTGFFRE